MVKVFTSFLVNEYVKHLENWFYYVDLSFMNIEKCKNREKVIGDWIIRWCKIDWLVPMCPMIINKLLQRMFILKYHMYL